MKPTLAVAMALALTVAGTQTVSAQPGHDKRNDQRYDQRDQHDNGHHNGWRKGGRIAPEDWRRGQRIDYRAHHLRAPPRGYEWREVDGNYVMAAVAGGVIASLILGAH